MLSLELCLIDFPKEYFSSLVPGARAYSGVNLLHLAFCEKNEQSVNNKSVKNTFTDRITI